MCTPSAVPAPYSPYLELKMNFSGYKEVYEVIPRSYVPRGSEAGDFSRDNLSQDRFSHKRNVKDSEGVLYNVF
jgi:hypothetical protein